MSDKEFNYTYVAPTEEERKEINSIKRQYAPVCDKESKLARLRALDKRVKGIPQAASLALGVIGLLIFGLGLTCILEWQMTVTGIILMVVGTPVLSAAYPVYKRLLEKGKEKYGKEIIALSEELLNEK